MTQPIRVYAPAKVNLHLKVLPKMQNGYHGIESVFQKVSLSDELIIDVNKGKKGCHVICDSMELPEKNTISTMFTHFSEYTGISFGVQVTLVKRIPSGAGLGGGSSDAAVFLDALNKYFKTNLSLVERTELAGKVGSDVPFFLSLDEKAGATGCAVVTGRGELIRVITPRSDLYFVLVCPEVHSSTTVAYNLVDQWMKKDSCVKFPALEDLESIYNSSISSWSFENSFTEPLVEQYKEIGAALSDLLSVGALFVRMSGSGSTVFGVFGSQEEAEKAHIQLNRSWKRSYLCFTAD